MAKLKANEQVWAAVNALFRVMDTNPLDAKAVAHRYSVLRRKCGGNSQLRPANLLGSERWAALQKIIHPGEAKAT